MANAHEFWRQLVGGRTPEGVGDWVVLDVHGSYPLHAHAPGLALLQRTESFESLAARLERLGQLDWVEGVLVRVSQLTAGFATAQAIGRALGRLAERKRVVGYLPQVDMRSLLVTARLAEVVAPAAAEVSLPGLAAEQVYLGAFLARHGIEFENLRIGDYKSALTPFSQERMDEFNREQLSVYLASAEESWLEEAAGARGIPLEAARGWFDAGFSSAQQLLDAGLITRVGYDDETVTTLDPHWGRTLELVGDQFLARRAAKGRDGVTVVPVVGAITSGRSRPTPPLPFGPGPIAGSDTVVAALRRADRDEHTKAIVLSVESGGGSALASDLIGRAVAHCGKPVVAVMGEVAASGGYYVLAQADHVVASPFTITGSIGVVIGKPVLEGFNQRHGLNPEVVGRERALWASPNKRFTDDERAWAEKVMHQVYGRFVDRVAAGRGLTAEKVDEIGRGRIWSGRDAAAIGLVDELGDLRTGVDAARRLAGLDQDAPVRTLTPGFQLPGAPTLGKDPASTLAALWPFGQERVLTWMDTSLTIR